MSKFGQTRTHLGSKQIVDLLSAVAKYSGLRCEFCGFPIAVGHRYVGDHATKKYAHATCASPESARRYQFVNETLGRLLETTRATQRRKVLDAALQRLPQGPERGWLLLEAARVEAEIVLAQVDGLKTIAAKRRRLEAGLVALRHFEVSELQEAYVGWLHLKLESLNEHDEP